MTRPRIIGLMGYAGAGKDTVAALLSAFGYQRRAFADKLRELALAIDPILAEEGPGGATSYTRLTQMADAVGFTAAKREIPAVREFLQRLGTSCRNIIWEDVWVDKLCRDFQRAKNGATMIVVSDVRFNNEIDTIRAYGGTIWRIDRPGTGPANAHVSEHEWKRRVPDLVIQNKSTIANLRAQITEALGVDR